jgi:tetratricopeptide (TPR) repeat protein
MKCPFRVLLFTLLISTVIILCGTSMGSASPVQQKAKPAVVAQPEEEESPPGYEDEYNCWDSANKEADFVKRGKMLIACIEKYPKSTLMPTFEGSYKNLFFESSTNKKYQDLETLAELWLKLHPDDYDTIARIAEAAANLGHDEKYVQCLEKLYKMKPTSSLPADIARTYKKLNNKAKYIEWTEIAIKLPENETSFMMRLELVQTYMESKDLAKAMEWARSALKSADLVKDPSADTRTQLIAVRHTCYDIIAKISYEQDKFPEAIKNFKLAIKAKEYAEGYYFIGNCLQNQKKAEDAMIWYAKTGLWCEKNAKECGEFATKANKEEEKIYRALHDNNTTAMFKNKNKAKEKPDSYWTSDEN